MDIITPRRRHLLKLNIESRLRSFFKKHPKLQRNGWRSVEKYGLRRPMTDLAFKVMANHMVESVRK